MYKSFHVKNFRCFKDLQINDLGRVNLIAGKNNVGKTTLLEAMYLLAGNRNSKTLLRKIVSQRRPYPRDVEPETRSLASWSTVFKDLVKKKPIEMTARATTFPALKTKGLSPLSLRISDVPDFGYSDDEALRELTDLRLGDIDEDAEVIQLTSSLDDHPLYLLLTSGRLLRSRTKFTQLCSTCLLQARVPVSAHENAGRFVQLQNAKKVDVLVKRLQVIENRLTDLRLSTDERQPFLDADIGLPRLIPLNNLGEGMNRMAELILAMHEVSAGIIFIDEIENGIHHSVQKKVWKAMGQLASKPELDIQVFATTHSLEMIRAAYEAFSEDNKLDEFRYHRLDRDRDTGDIEAVTYNKFGMEALAAFDFEHEMRG